MNGDFMDGSGKNGEGAITSYVLGRWTPDNHLTLILAYGMVVITTTGKLPHSGYMTLIFSA